MAFIQTVKQFVTLCFEKCYTSKVVVIIRHTLLLLLLEGNAYFCLVVTRQSHWLVLNHMQISDLCFFCVCVCCGLPISHPSGQFVHSLFHFPVYTEFNCRGWADTSKSVRGLLLVCMISFPYFSVILAAQLSPFPSLTVSPRETRFTFPLVNVDTESHVWSRASLGLQYKQSSEHKQ